MNTVFVQPTRPDVLVPNPQDDYKPLSVEGAEVPDDRYWKRRLADGDVKLASKKAAKKDNG